MQPHDTTKLCECGCGQPAATAKATNKKLGWIKDQPLRFAHGHNRRVAPDKRFWANVSPGNFTECWHWQGAFTSLGYGVISDRGQHIGAHRFSWVLHFGPIPGALQVLHRCDNPACVNPYHLFLGTQLDNVRDMDAKGRRVTQCNPRRGETHADAKLTEADVTEIRQLSALGVSQRKIAKQFGMSQQQISDIVRRRRWAHVP